LFYVTKEIICNFIWKPKEYWTQLEASMEPICEDEATDREEKKIHNEEAA
jgi:hypothetical protein